MKANVIGWIAAGVLALATNGCENKEAQRCRDAQQSSARAWQAYESAAREAVNHADDEANAAGRTASAAGQRAQSLAAESSQRLLLSDLVPDLPAPDAAAPAAPTAAPTTATNPAAAADAARRAQLIAARSVALSLVETVRSVGNDTREIGGAISSRNSDSAHEAMTRVGESVRRAQAAATRIAQTVSASTGTDPISQALTRVSDTARALAQAATDTAQTAQAAMTSLERADAALERANAALSASGAAFRNAVMARNAARAVPEDPSQVLFVRARTTSDEAWSICSAAH